MTQFLDILLHLDTHLNAWASQLGPWTYVLLFAIVFCETGFVVTPFLPGDSLLFAMGALAASDNPQINLPLACVILCCAGSFCGKVPIVKKHFELVVLVIVGISVIPVVIHALRSRRSPAQVEPKAAP